MKTKAKFIGLAICLLCAAFFVAKAIGDVGALGKAYDQLLIKQGYKPLKAPRSDFGVGTVIPVDSKRNLYIAGQQECFPGLDAQIQSGTVKLLDSKDVRGLNISASGNYSPTGSASFLTKLAAAFGFKSSATMDVSFGDTTALDMTEVTLQNYLMNHTVSKVCLDKLKDPKNAVIFSMARVATLTYTFNGNKDVNASVNADALKSAVSAAGSLDYTHTTDNSITINTPLYVGYSAFSLKDLAISTPESASGVGKVSAVRVVKTTAATFPY